MERNDTPKNNEEINNNVSFYLSKFLLNLAVSDIADEEQKERLMNWIDKYPKSLGAIYWNYVEGPDDKYEVNHLSEDETVREKQRKKEHRHPFRLREIILKKEV